MVMKWIVKAVKYQWCVMQNQRCEDRSEVLPVSGNYLHLFRQM